jgi:hypothetical protein
MQDPRKNTLNILLFLIWLGMGLSLTTARAERAEGGGSKLDRFTINLTFMSYLDIHLPEQDVFIEREPGSGEVYRVTMADDDLNLPLYKAARPVPRNPFDAAAIGPHPKGTPFGLTLGEWLQHAGTATYTCANGEGLLDTKFSGLIRFGVYTIWHSFTAIPATTPFSGYLDLPLGARDGSTSVFVADENGQAAVSRRFKPCLQMSESWTTALLAISYHSDGRTYAGRPGKFGYNSHVPLFLLLPRRERVEALQY